MKKIILYASLIASTLSFASVSFAQESTSIIYDDSVRFSPGSSSFDIEFNDTIFANQVVWQIVGNLRCRYRDFTVSLYDSRTGQWARVSNQQAWGRYDIANIYPGAFDVIRVQLFNPRRLRATNCRIILGVVNESVRPPVNPPAPPPVNPPAPPPVNPPAPPPVNPPAPPPVNPPAPPPVNPPAPPPVNPPAPPPVNPPAPPPVNPDDPLFPDIPLPGVNG